jgi:tripartite-type tricarboxylate transporter receptor subunit TctC
MRGLAAPVTAALILTAPSALLAQSFPSKPFKVIVPSAPGVGTDILARGIGQFLGPRLGQPFVAENRVGADGAIGMEACARSAADGYTLCSGASNTLAFNPVLKLNLPYTPNDFAAVIHSGFFDSGLAVNARVNAASLKEFLDLAAAKPDAVSWGTFDVVGSGYLYMEWLKRFRNARLYHVPYKAPPQLLQALVIAEVDAGIYAVAQMQSQIRSGKLRLLAVTSEKRHPLFPEAPTFLELGINLPLRNWYGFVAPAGTPREIVARLNEEINKAIADPEWREKFLTAYGIEPVGGSAERFDAFMKKNRQDFAELVKSLGVKPH